MTGANESQRGRCSATHTQLTPEQPPEYLSVEARGAVMSWLANVSAGTEPLCDLAGSGAVGCFEREFASFVGAEFAVAAPSATLALLALLQAIGVGSGDEVVASTYGWGSSVAPILTLGAVPVFADIEADTLGLDPLDVARRITPQTRAILATHMCGVPCDVDELERIAGRAGLPLLFDAAQALGAVPTGRSIGNCGVASVFSFGHQKLLPLGDGGMITTNDHRLFVELLRITQHPIRTLPQAIEFGLPDAFDEVSLSSRMHGVAASMGLAMLPAIPDRIARRREVCDALVDRLSALPGIRVSGTERASRSAFHTFALTLVPAELGDAKRDDVVAALRSLGIQISAGPVRVPLHLRHRFRELSSFDTTSRSQLAVCPVAQHRCDETEIMLESESRWTRVPKARVQEIGDAFESVVSQLLDRHRNR